MALRGQRSAVSGIPHFLVYAVHFELDRGGQRHEVILVRHVCCLDRIENSYGRQTREEELRARLRSTLRSLDDDRKHGQACVDRDAECTLVKGQEFAFGTAGAFGVHDQRVSPFCCNAHSIVDGLARRPTLGPIDLDDANSAHGLSNDGNLEDFLLGKEATLEWEMAKEDWNIEHRKMIGGYDVSLLRVDLVDIVRGDGHRRNLEVQEGPESQNSVMHGRRWPKRTVDDDDRGEQQRKQKEERNEYERTDSCEQRAGHGGSVDEMEKMHR